MARFYTFTPGTPRPKSPLEKYKEKMQAEKAPTISYLPYPKEVQVKTKTWNKTFIVITLILVAETLYMWLR